MEMEHNSSLPFLDILVTRDSLQEQQHCHTQHHTFYQGLQKTRVDRYLHFTSHHPKHQKLTVAKTLLNRVNTHILNENHKHSELQNICSILQNNGFPTRTTFTSSTKPHSHALITNTSLPYIQGTSKKFQEFWMRQEWGSPWNRFMPLPKFCSLPKNPQTRCIVYLSLVLTVTLFTLDKLNAILNCV